MRYMSDLEHVRERTGMYIGNRDVRGMHHLVTEVVDNSIDEVMAGHAKNIHVTVNVDGSLTVSDDGRGIPVAVDESIGRSALEGVMTMLKYGGKFDNNAYKTSGGLHGIGVKAVNFLSEWCDVEVRRDGAVIGSRTNAASRPDRCKNWAKPIRRDQDVLQARSRSLWRHQV